MKKKFSCKFCNSIMLTTYQQYRENPYCIECLHQRLRASINITPVKVFGIYRPLKIKD